MAASRRPRPARRIFAALVCAAALYAGLALLVAAFCPQDVRTAVLAHRILPAVREVDPSAPAREANRSLVHVRGASWSVRPVSDPAFGIETNAVALVRIAEMYQWTEVSGTPVRYEAVWTTNEVPSAAFRVPAGHENPPFPVALRSRTDLARDPRVGRLFVQARGRFADSLPAETLPAAGSHVAGADGWQYLAPRADAGRAPQIGDVRVRFRIVPHGPVSVVAQLRDDKVPASLRGKEDSPGAALVIGKGEGGVDVFACRRGEAGAEELLGGDTALPRWALLRAGAFAEKVVSPSTVGQLLRGLLVSVALFVLTVLLSLPLGLVVAFGRMSPHAVPAAAAKTYVSLMRGTPLMLQLLFVYFGPYYLFGMSLEGYPAFLAAVLAFCLNYAAYFAEIYRAGIESIPRGQHEAAQVLGFTKRQTFFRIVLPQVVKRILPPVTNEVITLVKDTSLAQVIAVVEMFTIAKQLGNKQTSIAPLLVAGIFYYLFNYVVAWGMERIEKRLAYYR